MKRNAAFFVMLILWTTPAYVYGISRMENKASNSKQKGEENSINNEPNEHKEDRTDIQKDEAKENALRETRKLQYAQLLEVHRTYFTVFLQVTSIYIAVMGACISIVEIHIRKMKIDERDGSKTVLLALVLFAILLSIIFRYGARYGNNDADKRRDQIVTVSKQLNITPVNVGLLKQLIVMMSRSSEVLIMLWFVLLNRSLMFFKKLETLCKGMRCVLAIVIILWVVTFVRGFMCVKQ